MPITSSWSWYPSLTNCKQDWLYINGKRSYHNGQCEKWLFQWNLLFSPGTDCRRVLHKDVSSTGNYNSSLHKRECNTGSLIALPVYPLVDIFWKLLSVLGREGLSRPSKALFGSLIMILLAKGKQNFPSIPTDPVSHCMSWTWTCCPQTSSYWVPIFLIPNSHIWVVLY